jgi:hypothetical protein
MKFRKKPVVVEAIRWDGSNFEELKDFVTATNLVLNSGDILIDTLEGEMRASTGDWIIKGVQGEFYPCKPDIFEKTYEPAEDESEPVWIEELTFKQVNFLFGEGGDADRYINALRVLGAKARGVNVDQQQVDSALHRCEWLEDLPPDEECY